MSIFISFPDKDKKNFVARLDAGCHEFVESPSRAMKFSSVEEADAYIQSHKWLKDLDAKDLIKLESRPDSEGSPSPNPVRPRSPADR